MAYAVDIIERNARTQRRMIDDLLDVSRIVTGRLRIDARPIPSLAPVIAMVVDSFRPVAHGKGLTVVTDLANDAGPLRADPERLQQVAWNLLSNAIHFTPPGGRIEVRCGRKDSQAMLYVRIPDEVSARNRCLTSSSGTGREELHASAAPRSWAGSRDRTQDRRIAYR